MNLLYDMADALALLREHNAAPAQISVSPELFDKLRAECSIPAQGAQNSLFGLPVVVDRRLEGMSYRVEYKSHL